VSLEAGRTLAQYRITAAIGVGGMGEVYRATDTTLGRDVAIKVLPSDLAQDPERLARFEREAKLLASLNHPNIAHVYGFENANLADGSAAHFLAMELVEGEDLADRLKRGPLPIGEALEIGKQIALALEDAHEHGIVHRDLKPANIKLGNGEKVKILDFGLAKAFSEDSGEASQPDVSHSPTLTRAGTEAGMILGTAAYMSPEQARGKTVDKRADIWAFGVVLYEMLTGQRLFAGETVSDVLAGVLKTDIDFAKLPMSIPPAIRLLLRRCLDRNPRNRLHDMADARIVLDEVLRGDAEPDATPHGTRRSPPWLTALPWMVAALALSTAIGIGLRFGSLRPPALRPLTTFGILMPEDYFLALSQSPLLDLSADGRTLLFAAQGRRTSSVFRRSFDRMTISRIEGTEGAENPALSPDGRSIAFFAGGMLRKIAPDGGTSVAVAEARAPRGLSWAPDGSLFFSPLYTSPLFKVVATGGKPVAVTTLDAAKGERSHRWPQVLPDGRTVIFTVGIAGSPGDYDGANIDAQRFDTGERRTLLRGARMARYTALGYLVYQRAKTLLAVKFNPERLETIGEPFAIQEGVGGEPSSGAGYFSVSSTGVVAVAPEASIPNDRILVLADHAGRETPLTAPAAAFNHPRFSPDGKRLAFAIGSGSGGDDDVYVLELASQRMQRLTFGQGHGMPLWTPDGKRIVFTNGRSGETGMGMKAADGGGEAVALVNSTEFVLADSWLADGRRLVVTNSQRSINLQLLDPEAGGKMTPLLAGPVAGASAAALSPDGRYVAYTSTETGTDEVVVETFPTGRGKWLVSVGGGATPAWSRDGRTLYFVAGDGLMAVDVDTHEVFRGGVPRALFTGPYVLHTVIQRNYDVGPDGRFVLVKRQVGASKPGELVVLDGWDAADPSRGAAR
jgi:serine/threonine protein kinase/Tol biopolymer transport system component